MALVGTPQIPDVTRALVATRASFG